ncbi:MAG: helix-turn-helix domain-containing protein [Capnocytophaga sp.]|nr:helix-turn-helix domain-containing protein [Capnocytophaga sp.]
MNTIFTIGIFISLFLAVLLFVKQKKTLPDTILGVWLLFIGIHLLSYYLHYLGYYNKYPHLLGVTHPFPLLYAPFLYLYIYFSLQSKQHFKLKHLLHFAPFILTYLYLLPFYFGYTAQEKLIFDTQDFNSVYRLFFSISFLMFIISWVVYSIISYRKLCNYQQLINANFAYEENISLRWLQFFIIGIGVVFGSGIIVSVLRYQFNFDFGFNTDFIFFILIVLLVASIGFEGIRQQGIFTGETTKMGDIVRTKSFKYKKSGLKSNEMQTLHEQLLSIMTQEKPYLEPKLTLSQLAERLGISSNNLSQVINQYEGKNFYDFVNSYRVSEFISRACNQANKNLNILGIALDSGFNSKSSFNEVFKKQTGKTPSNYLKLQEKQNNI